MMEFRGGKCQKKKTRKLNKNRYYIPKTFARRSSRIKRVVKILRTKAKKNIQKLNVKTPSYN